MEDGERQPETVGAGEPDVGEVDRRGGEVVGKLAEKWGA